MNTNEIGLGVGVGVGVGLGLGLGLGLERPKKRVRVSGLRRPRASGKIKPGGDGMKNWSGAGGTKQVLGLRKVNTCLGTRPGCPTAASIKASSARHVRTPGASTFVESRTCPLNSL